MSVEVGFSKGLWAERADSIRQTVAVHALVLGFALVAATGLHVFRGVTLPDHGQAGGWLLVAIFKTGLIMTGMMLLLYQVAAMLLARRPGSPLRELLRRLMAIVGNPVRLASGVLAVSSLLIFSFAFVIGKATATTFLPFSWDVTFDQWDVALHFGYRPYELLLPVFGNAVGVLLLNANYYLWFFLIYVYWFHFAVMARPGVERTRFFLGFFLVWFLGGVIGASLFSSAGPCYFDKLGLGVDPYAPLMERLRVLAAAVPITALQTQNDLWMLWEKQSVLGGVSAMPSMHNATSLLFVLVAWNKGRMLRGAMIAHAALISAGAVMLGWHYAVDVYAGWGVTLLCWMLATGLARWWEARPEQQRFTGVFERRMVG